MPSLCQSFRKEAGFVWNRMQKAPRVGMSLSEETLTEFALLNIALAHARTKISIHLATKHEEAKHGGDWEWWLIHKGQGIGFRVQAKRLFPSGRYESFFDKKKGSKPYDQLDKLVAAAQKEKPVPLVPLYCFYNFPVRKHPFSARTNTCGHFRGPSFWGCSIAFPEKLRAEKSDQVTKLKPIMSPWHELFCESDEVDLVSAARAFLRKAGKGGDETAPRQLPPHVTRLIRLADQISEQDYPPDLGDEYWSTGDGPEDVSGIVLFRDLRDPHMAQNCRFRMSALRVAKGVKRTRYAHIEFFAF
jgi:hypothetical protein